MRNVRNWINACLLLPLVVWMCIRYNTDDYWHIAAIIIVAFAIGDINGTWERKR